MLLAHTSVLSNRILPVNINTVKAFVLHEMGRRVDKRFASPREANHVGERLAPNRPATNRDKRLERGFFLLESHQLIDVVLVMVVNGFEGRVVSVDTNKAVENVLNEMMSSALVNVPRDEKMASISPSMD